MTKKDYDKIAESIAFCMSITNEQGENTLDNLIDELCFRFKEENPRFNEEIFVKACNDYEKIC